MLVSYKVVRRIDEGDEVNEVNEVNEVLRFLIDTAV